MRSYSREHSLALDVAGRENVAIMVDRSVTITESVRVARPPAEVFDFTQDFARRVEWDRSILGAEVLAAAPAPRVRVRGAGGLRAVFRYRQFERPVQTSLVLEEVESAVIAGGGGSWRYTAEDGGNATLWTQTNTLIVRSGWWRALLVPLVRRQLRAATIDAMRRARERIEGAGPTGAA